MTKTFDFDFPIRGALRLQGNLQVSGEMDRDGIKIDKVLWLQEFPKPREAVDVTELVRFGSESLWEELELAAYNHCDGDSCPALATGYLNRQKECYE